MRAAARNSKVTISGQAGSQEDGFVLSYEGTEENCTFEALLSAGRNRLQDTVNEMLWRTRNDG